MDKLVVEEYNKIYDECYDYLKTKCSDKYKEPVIDSTVEFILIKLVELQVSINNKIALSANLQESLKKIDTLNLY